MVFDQTRNQLFIWLFQLLQIPDLTSDDDTPEEDTDNVIDVNIKEEEEGNDNGSVVLQRSGVAALIMTLFSIIMVSVLSL